MKIEIPININGSLPVPRAITCLINQKIITISDFGWYLIFVMQADFGHKYKTYGVITRGDQIIADEYNCDFTTVFKKRKKLIKVGLLKTDGKYTSISNYELFTRKDKTIIPIIGEINKTNNKKTLSEYFLKKDIFLKKQQDFIEKRRIEYLESE